MIMKIECYMQGVRDYINLLKEDIQEQRIPVSLDLRNGRVDKEKALELIKLYEEKDLLH